MLPDVRRDRRPRDMPLQFHNAISAWFLSRFGVDYRGKALFCSGDLNVAMGYKDPMKEVIELLPRSPFSICYSLKCKDLFGYYQFRWSNRTFDEIALNKELDELEFRHLNNDGLREAAATGHEVMVFSRYCSYKIV